jgi:diguanylate cyclase (GGDEF)-like protein
MHTNFKTENRESNLANTQAANSQLGIAPADLQQTLKLAGLLQTSLETETVLHYFIESASEHVDFDAVSFEYNPLEISLLFGVKKRHTCSYRLKLAGEFLGELIFSRRHRFSEQEMESLEGLLGQLIYPLRNAIWYQKAVRSAQMDPLTGINNRAALDNVLLREVDLANRNNTLLSMIIVDIDHFKNVNDQYGHSVGDSVLKQFSKILADNLRGSDVLFRYGGEEFVIVLTGTSSDDAVLVANRIRQAIENNLFCVENLKLPVTASFGTATLINGDSSNVFFENADAALYKAKELGRNRVIPHRPDSGLKTAAE